VVINGALQAPIPEALMDSGSRGRSVRIARTVSIRAAVSMQVAAVFIRDLAVSTAALAAVLGVEVAAAITEIHCRS
jgi:hypothetical protein